MTVRSLVVTSLHMGLRRSKMNAPQNLQDLQSCLVLVKYLNRFSPRLTAALRLLGQTGVAFTWESSKQEAFKAIKKEITRVPVPLYLLQDGKPVV